MNGWPLILAAAIVAAIVAVPLAVRWEYGPHQDQELKPNSEIVATVQQDFAALPLTKPVKTVPFVKPPAMAMTEETPPPPPPSGQVYAVNEEREDNGYRGHRDVCALHGLRRVSFTRHHHVYWRCRR